MRSYLDVIIDLQDGKDVDYEELKMALLFCRDMLFFTERDLKKLLGKPSDLQIKFVESNIETRFQNKKNPLDLWFGKTYGLGMRWKNDEPEINN